jgi:hypothetical protein
LFRNTGLSDSNLNVKVEDFSNTKKNDGASNGQEKTTGTQQLNGPSTKSRHKTEKSSEASFSTITSLGSFLLQRKAIEEGEIEKMKSRDGDRKIHPLSHAENELNASNK